jgi:hypothetical protein
MRGIWDTTAPSNTTPDQRARAALLVADWTLDQREPSQSLSARLNAPEAVTETLELLSALGLIPPGPSRACMNCLRRQPIANFEDTLGVRANRVTCKTCRDNRTRKTQTSKRRRRRRIA